MNKKLYALGLLCIKLCGSIVTDDYVNRVFLIESSGNPHAVGDNGKSISGFQISEAAFEDAMEYGQLNDYKNFYDVSHKGYYLLKDDYDFSKLICTWYLKYLELQMHNKGYDVTKLSLYMAYNMGFRGGKAFGFNPNHKFLKSSIRHIFNRADFYFNK